MRAVEAGVVQQSGEIAKGLGRVGDAVEAALEPGHAVIVFELARDMEHGLGADHHVGLGAVHGLHFAEAAVAGKAAQHAQAEFVEQRRDVPELAADVPLADQIDVVAFDAGNFQLRRTGSGSRVPMMCL